MGVVRPGAERAARRGDLRPAGLLIVSAAIAPLISARLAPHRTVALGMLIMAAGLALFGRLGAGATYASLMPGILLFGAGAGLMQVPLTNAVLQSVPPARSGVAGAILNASREVAGLLGITIIGAVLRTRQGDALRHGTSASGSFLAGYHAGLLLTVILIAAGVVVGYAALRKLPSSEAPGPVPAAGLSGDLAQAEEAAAAELSR